MDSLPQRQWPASLVLRTLIIVATFVLIVGSPVAWLGGVFHSHHAILPGTEPWQALNSQRDWVMTSAKEAIDNGSLTVDRGAQLYVIVLYLDFDLNRSWEGDVGYIREGAKTIFCQKWQPAEEAPQCVINRCAEDEAFRKLTAENSFKFKFDDLVDKYRGRDSGASLEDAWRCVLGIGRFVAWLVKWYYLLTVPALLIFLTSQGGWSHLRRLLLHQPRKLILAVCGGPGGLFAISQASELGYAYHRKRRWFLATRGREPNQREQAALWLMEDRLARCIEEAYWEAYQKTETSLVDFRKPAMACLVAWLIGLCLNPVTAKGTRVCERVACAISAHLQEPESAVQKGSDDRPSPLAVMPTTVALDIRFERTEVVGSCRPPIQSEYRLVGRPRAPPAVAKEQSENISFSILGCTLQKG